MRVGIPIRLFDMEKARDARSMSRRCVVGLGALPRVRAPVFSRASHGNMAVYLGADEPSRVREACSPAFTACCNDSLDEQFDEQLSFNSFQPSARRADNHT